MMSDLVLALFREVVSSRVSSLALNRAYQDPKGNIYVAGTTVGLQKLTFKAVR